MAKFRAFRTHSSRGQKAIILFSWVLLLKCMGIHYFSARMFLPPQFSAQWKPYVVRECGGSLDKRPFLLSEQTSQITKAPQTIKRFLCTSREVIWAPACGSEVVSILQGYLSGQTEGTQSWLCLPPYMRTQNPFFAINLQSNLARACSF